MDYNFKVVKNLKTLNYHFYYWILNDIRINAIFIYNVYLDTLNNNFKIMM